MLSCITFTTHSSILVNKVNLVHNLFLVYLSISTCFGQLCAHKQEKQLSLCDTWYLLFCVDDCLVCRVESPCVDNCLLYRVESPCVDNCLVYRVESPCVDDCLVCRVKSPCIPGSHPHRVRSTKFRINTVVSPDDGINSSPKLVEIDKFTKNKLCTELALFTIIYRDARSTKHKTLKYDSFSQYLFAPPSLLETKQNFCVFFSVCVLPPNKLTLRRRIKSHLLFAGIIRSSPLSLR